MRTVVATIVVLCVGAMGAGALEAGAAKRSIVPPFPTRMGGYFDRVKPFEGVKTPIYAKALVCAEDDTKLAVLTVDLLNVTRELCDAARARIVEATGIPADHIMISAAHNHSAPSGFTRTFLFGGEFDQRLFDFLAAEMAQSVIDANASMRPALLGVGVGHLNTITRNRQQNNDTVIDPAVTVLRVQEADSRSVIATVFNFTGHPVILGSDNLLVCGEYPGQAQETVEHVLGGVALFTQGACGDITMKRSGNPFQEIERLGRIVAAEVIKTCEQIAVSDNAALTARFEDVPVNARELPSMTDAKAAETAAAEALKQAEQSGANETVRKRLERTLDSAQWVVRLATYKEEHPTQAPELDRAPVQVLQLGPVVLVGIPGELFVEYGLEVKQRVLQSTQRQAVLVGYANDYLGYLVTPRAVATGGYEAATARLDASAPRAMVEAAVAWAEEMAK